MGTVAVYSLLLLLEYSENAHIKEGCVKFLTSISFLLELGYWFVH